MLSLALSASKIKEKARVVAIDLRGHGKTSTENDLDLSIETMCNDVLAVLKEMNGDSPLAIVLVGHRLWNSYGFSGTHAENLIKQDAAFLKHRKSAWMRRLRPFIHDLEEDCAQQCCLSFLDDGKV
ncbi:uncharacterized protein LOC110633424 isoform X2 [Hevea brasiliensis]|uniref:uncharacterized protein LOC110633424 isoform X2 n=1 Tax=Hevea brasiliensis TaxID=3981 RepID=UPI0025CB7AEA|nr:uncharacterized protein LOC110633424 isoform X2 [Hevea brasiliensis]